jgi:hypothetical protein
MIFGRKVKKKSNWSTKFAWFPVKGIQQIHGYSEDEELHVWIWWEKYQRYFNYGAPVNYVIQ